MADYITEQDDSNEAARPTRAAVIRRAFDAAALELRVSMPAEVLTYDHKKQMVSVQPHFKRKYRDGSIDEPPVISNVPVAFPRAGKSFIVLPIEKGHIVQLIFSDRSLEKWLSTGKIVDPEDTRAHHISDPFAIPGGYSFADPADVNNEKDIIIKNADAKGFHEIRIKKNGHIQFINKTDELVKVLNDLLQAILDARTPTCGGPQPLNNPKWPDIVRRLKTFLEK